METPPLPSTPHEHAWHLHLWHLRARSDFRRRIVIIVTATLLLDFASAGLAKLWERDTAAPFATYWSALFWTTTQLLTVSSQLPNPLGTKTKFLDVLLEMWAISFVAALAATLGAFFHHQTSHRSAQQALARRGSLAEPGETGDPGHPAAS